MVLSSPSMATSFTSAPPSLQVPGGPFLRAAALLWQRDQGRTGRPSHNCRRLVMKDSETTAAVISAAVVGLRGIADTRQATRHGHTFPGEDSRP